MQHESTPLKVSSMDSKDYYSNYLKDHAHYKWHADTEKTLNKLVIFDPLGQNTSVSENGMGDFWGIYVLENLPDLMVIGYYHNLIDEYEANEAQIKLFDRLGYFDSDVLTEEQAERYFRRKNLAERQDELSALLSQEGTVEAYEKAVESVFNITIDDDGTLNRAKDYIAGHALPEDPINALKQLDYYYEGVNEFAGWLAEQTGASTYERSKVFQQYMGPITIARVSEIPQEGIADSKGFTQDHIIYDRFDVEKYGDEVMLPDLVIHELAHAFVGSAGFGDYRQSPLYDQALVDWMDAVLDAFPNADRNSATSGNEEIGGTPETIANFIQNLATGAVQLTPEQQESLRPIIEDALAVNKLRHTSIPEMATQLGTDINTKYTNTRFSEGINVRFSPGPNSPRLPYGLALDETMIILGQTTIITPGGGDEVWFYVGIDRGEGEFQFHDYGWVSEQAINSGSVDTEGLPEISPGDTNPFE